MKIKTIPLLLAVAVFPAWSQTAPSPVSGEAATLKAIAQQAVLHSPEVTTRWRNFKAAEEEIGVARGGFLPRLDLTWGKGRENLETPSAAEKDYTRTGYTLTLNQMLFDGFATRNEMRKLDKARLVRYYELLEASENTALEAARAYLDVLRYRFLVDLAEDNYVQHKATYEQILRRTQSGVGRRVDLEQAGSRLALAEVNLTTETANLHDVSARYQRLVGAQPPAAIAPPAKVGGALPESPKAALDILHRRNPTLYAAIENIESAQYDLYARRAAYSPRLDLRGRKESTENYLGETGDRDYRVAELVVSWNLFNGGSDRARDKQYQERKYLAVEMREKACRDTRQTMLIAYNDVQRLREQATFLATQVSLLEKTRNAYRDQFNVGQRSLLDLLDTENELLSARRAAVNADTDLTAAYLRTYAGMGTLLEFLGLQRLESATPAGDELADVNPDELCPADPVAVPMPDRDALNAKAMSRLEAPKVTAPVAPVVSAVEDDVAARVRGWAEAWSAKDYSAYVGFYAPTFTPDGGLSREDWDQLRRARITPRSTVSVEVQDLKVRMDGEDRAFADFRQVYRSNVYSDTTKKTLEMIKVNGKWLINRESSVPCTGNTVGGCKGLTR